MTGKTDTIKARPVTQRKQVEEKLRKNEQQLAEAQRLAHLGSWEWDINSDKLAASAEMCRIFDVPPEELDATYAGIMKMVHPDDRGAYEKDIRDAIAGRNSFDSYHRFIRPDGTVRTLHSKGTVMVDEAGVPVSLIGSCQDVTERKQIEDALLESEERYRSLVELAPDAVIIHQEGQFLYANAAALQLYGAATFEQLSNRNMLDFIHPDERAAARARMTELREGKKISPREFRMLRLDGGELPVEATGNLIEYRGKPAVQSIVRNISERKQAEEKIEVLNTNLMARASDLEAANRELEAFSYTASHDLRKPLTIISGYCGVILDKCAGKLDGECLEYLREIEDGATRMAALIDTLLNFSRMARCELRRETVDLSGLVGELAAGLRMTGPERKATFRIAEGTVANGDASLLRIALENLIGNAWKYTGKQEETVIEFGTVECGKTAYFVRDNGPGFDMEHADKLFLPFQRIPGLHDFEGHGIGLATVQRIIQRHGGQVWAEGTPGKGATFYFTLPADT